MRHIYYVLCTINLKERVAFISHRDCGHRNVPITTRESRPLGSPLFGLSLEFCDLSGKLGLEGGSESIVLQ